MVRSQLDMACQTFSYMYTGLILSHLLKPLLGDFKTVNHKFEGIKFENIVWIWCNPTFILCEFFLHSIGMRSSSSLSWFAATNFPDKKKFLHAKKKLVDSI